MDFAKNTLGGVSTKYVHIEEGGVLVYNGWNAINSFWFFVGDNCGWTWPNVSRFVGANKDLLTNGIKAYRVDF